MTDRKLLQQALDALKEYVSTVKSEYNHHSWDTKIVDAGKPAREAIEAIRTRLAQPEPEPVAWKVWTVHNHIFFSIGVQTFQINDVLEHEPEVSAEEFSEWLATQLRHALTQLSNTVPQKKEWVGLTDEEVKQLSNDCVEVRDENEFIRAIEAKLKEKNT
jgi:hypothetical protein